jgi:hypothetical protein
MAEHQIRFDDGAAYERMMGAWQARGRNSKTLRLMS